MPNSAGHKQGEWLWSAAKLLVLAASIGAGAVLVGQLAQVLLLLFGSVLVAVLLRSTARLFTGYLHVPERGAVAIATLLIAVALFGFFVLLGAQIRSQGAALLERMPDLAQAAEEQLGTDALSRWLERQRGPEIDGRALVISVASYTTRVVTVGAYILVVLAAGVYLALSPGQYLNGSGRDWRRTFSGCSLLYLGGTAHALHHRQTDQLGGNFEVEERAVLGRAYADRWRPSQLKPGSSDTAPDRGLGGAALYPILPLVVKRA